MLWLLLVSKNSATSRSSIRKVSSGGVSAREWHRLVERLVEIAQYGERARRWRTRGQGMRMNTPHANGSRVRAYAQFIAAVLYFFVARSLARRGALGLATEPWRPLVEQAMLVFLLLLGYAAFGYWLDRQMHPLSEQGLPRRQGWLSEAGVGLAVGWALAVVCVLPMLAAGGIAIVLSTQVSAWGWLTADAAFFALAALGAVSAFRGSGFHS